MCVYLWWLMSVDVWMCFCCYCSVWLKCFCRRRSVASSKCFRRRRDRWMCFCCCVVVCVSVIVVVCGVIVDCCFI